jgi:WD40 repeat protein
LGKLLVEKRGTEKTIEEVSRRKEKIKLDLMNSEITDSLDDEMHKSLQKNVEDYHELKYQLTIISHSLSRVTQEISSKTGPETQKLASETHHHEKAILDDRHTTISPSHPNSNTPLQKILANSSKFTLPDFLQKLTKANHSLPYTLSISLDGHLIFSVSKNGHLREWSTTHCRIMEDYGPLLTPSTYRITQDTNSSNNQFLYQELGLLSCLVKDCKSGDYRQI